MTSVMRRALYRCATTTALLNLKLVSLVEEFGGPSSGQDLWCPLAPKRVSYGDYKWELHQGGTKKTCRLAIFMLPSRNENDHLLTRKTFQVENFFFVKKSLFWPKFFFFTFLSNILSMTAPKSVSGRRFGVSNFFTLPGTESIKDNN